MNEFDASRAGAMGTAHPNGFYPRSSVFICVPRFYRGAAGRKKHLTQMNADE
jgi:hypothetical protein